MLKEVLIGGWMPRSLYDKAQSLLVKAAAQAPNPATPKEVPQPANSGVFVNSIETEGARAATLAFTLREQAQEMESPYSTKTPEQPDWDYIAKAFREIADDVELALAAAEQGALRRAAEAKELLRDCVLALRVLRTIGQARSTKTINKVEIPSWGMPIMERSKELLEEVEFFLVADVKVIQSEAGPAMPAEQPHPFLSAMRESPVEQPAKEERNVPSKTR
jgi:hypothetical protein